MKGIFKKKKEREIIHNSTSTTIFVCVCMCVCVLPLSLFLQVPTCLQAPVFKIQHKDHFPGQFSQTPIPSSSVVDLLTPQGSLLVSRSLRPVTSWEQELYPKSLCAPSPGQGTCCCFYGHSFVFCTVTAH